MLQFLSFVAHLPLVLEMPNASEWSCQILLFLIWPPPSSVSVLPTALFSCLLTDDFLSSIQYCSYMQVIMHKNSWVFLKWLHHLTQLFKLCCSEARKVNLLLYKWSLSFWDSHFYCVHVVLDLLESSSLLLGFHTPSGLGEFQQKLSDLQFLVFFCRLQTRTSLPLIYPVDREGR